MSEAISPVSPVMSVVRENFEQLLAVLEDFERVLVERAGDGPSGPNYDPELLTVGYDLLDKVQALRVSLGLPEVAKAALGGAPKVERAARTYRATLRTRADLEAQRDREGYTDAWGWWCDISWGWWCDICPGATLTLREATDADMARCSLRDGSSRNLQDWLCELGPNGCLVSKKAIAHLVELPGGEA